MYLYPARSGIAVWAHRARRLDPSLPPLPGGIPVPIVSAAGSEGGLAHVRVPQSATHECR